MPTLHNGIGTWYYGKKNLQTRPGVCDSCHKPTELQSYDTRLWFVIFLIPVIPLGRKHILDKCPKCSRHRSLPLKEWEALKAKNISEAMAAYKASPADAKAAVKLH